MTPEERQGMVEGIESGLKDAGFNVKMDNGIIYVSLQTRTIYRHQITSVIDQVIPESYMMRYTISRNHYGIKVYIAAFLESIGAMAIDC